MSNSVKKGKPLSPKQILAVNHLANGKSDTEVAKLVGVTRQTIGNWNKNQAFLNAISKTQQTRFEKLAHMYYLAEAKSFEVRQKILLDEAAKDADRLRAAKEISSTAQQYREILQFEKRLKKLEMLAKDIEKESEW